LGFVVFIGMGLGVSNDHDCSNDRWMKAFVPTYDEDEDELDGMYLDRLYCGISSVVLEGHAYGFSFVD
jgi:hypothetical protein